MFCFGRRFGRFDFGILTFGLCLSFLGMIGRSKLDFWVINPSSVGSKFDQCVLSLFCSLIFGSFTANSNMGKIIRKYFLSKQGPLQNGICMDLTFFPPKIFPDCWVGISSTFCGWFMHECPTIICIDLFWQVRVAKWHIFIASCCLFC